MMTENNWIITMKSKHYKYPSLRVNSEVQARKVLNLLNLSKYESVSITQVSEINKLRENNYVNA